jgi:hypothetical protein
MTTTTTTSGQTTTAITKASGTTWDDLIAAVKHSSRDKKLETMQEQFDKLLHKQCPVHPNANHSAIECYNLRKIFNAPPLDKNAKKKGKENEDDEPEVKSGGAHFQDTLKTVNVIFGGESGFTSKRAQKLARPNEEGEQTKIQATREVTLQAIQLQESNPSKTALLGTRLGDK